VATMPAMRNFVKSHRLQAWSTPEITETVDQLVLDYGKGDKPVRFRGAKLANTHLINAAVAALISLPEPERREGFVRALGCLEAIMAEDDDAAGDHEEAGFADPESNRPAKRGPGRTKGAS
jgi:hypothetical protein